MGDVGPFTNLGLIPTAGLAQSVPFLEECGIRLRISLNLFFGDGSGNGGIEGEFDCGNVVTMRRLIWADRHRWDLSAFSTGCGQPLLDEFPIRSEFVSLPLS
jgi:hypothetical protein